MEWPELWFSRKCPACGEHLQRFVPLIYSGEGIFDYTCLNKECPAEIIHLMLKEKS